MAKLRAQTQDLLSREACPNPKLLLPRLHSRLEKERAGLDRWRKRLLRASTPMSGRTTWSTAWYARSPSLESV